MRAPPSRDRGEGSTGLDGAVSLGRGISLSGIGKRYQGVTAVQDLDIEIKAGELVTLLGPSGSGKTTTLMMVAGFAEPTEGRILIGGRDVTYLPPHRRSIGVVFQHYALFPHMTVFENVAFPLRMRRLGSAEVEQKVDDALDLVELSALRARFPAELSGGQQQRVAFARAIVFDPPVLLLDEPLGALDKKLREAIQVEIKSLHRRLGLTMVYVTHDQSEALAISDRVAVLRGGSLEQIGSPADLYEAPRTRFVADFIGDANFLACRIEAVTANRVTLAMETGERLCAAAHPDLGVGAPVTLMIRPERVLAGGEAEAAGNQVLGVVEDASYVGDSTRYRVALASGTIVTARVQNRRGARIGARPGDRILLGWHADDVLVFPEDPR